MPLPPLADGTINEATELTILRYILDATQGGIGNVQNTYNKPVARKLTTGASYKIVANTAHSITIIAVNKPVDVNFTGSSVSIQVQPGSIFFLAAAKLFTVDIDITSGITTGEAHIVEMQPE